MVQDYRASFGTELPKHRNAMLLVALYLRFQAPDYFREAEHAGRVPAGHFDVRGVHEVSRERGVEWNPFSHETLHPYMIVESAV